MCYQGSKAVPDLQRVGHRLRVHPPVYLSHDQVHELAAASKYPGLVLVLAYCGIRWGESNRTEGQAPGASAE